MVALGIDSLLIRGAVGNSGGRKLAACHHLVEGAIAGRNLQTGTGTHLSVTNFQTMLVVYPAAGSVDAHVHIGIDRLHERGAGIVAATLEVAEESDAVRMGEVPSDGSGDIAQVRLAQGPVGRHRDIGLQRVLLYI